MRQNLKSSREQRGWSQEETARRLGVSQPYLSMLESGERPLTPSLARRVARVFGLPPTYLPTPQMFLDVQTLDAQELAEDVAALGYPGYAYLRGRRKKRNPAVLLMTALAQRDLEPRLTEALPWLVMRYANMNCDWLVSNAKLHNLQNRLGFVVALARRLDERLEGRDTERVRAQARLEAALEQSRLAREDTLCQESLNEVERKWLRENRGEEAGHWNLLTGWRPETLRHVT